jgi:membrane protein
MRVHERFGELEGGVVAAAVTLSIFVSLFPALLIGTAVVGYIADGRVDLADDVISRLGLTGTAADVMREAVSSAEDSRRAASIIGFIGLAWSALGVVLALQRAIDKAWQVKQEGIKGRAVAAVWLLVTGALIIASIALTAAIVAVLPGWAAPVAVIPTIAVNVGVFWFTFVMLGARKVGWRPVLPGALVAGIGLQVLTIAGAFLVPRAVANSSALYGSLGVVFAIIAWLFFFGRLIVYASILNVVLYEERRGTVTVDIEAPRVPGEVPVEADRGGVVVASEHPAVA